MKACAWQPFGDILWLPAPSLQKDTKGPSTYFSCCSATASRSASGSVATTTFASSFSASLSDNSWWEKEERAQKPQNVRANKPTAFLLPSQTQRIQTPWIAHMNTAESRVSLLSHSACASPQKPEEVATKNTSTDSPSSGFGHLTVEKSGSGSFCSGTGMGGWNPKALKASCT